MARLAIESARVTLVDAAGRCLIELHGRDGSSGVGETGPASGGFERARRVCEAFIGVDALKTGEIVERLRHTAMPGVAGGFENAVWDLVGHHLRSPLYVLLGAGRPAPALAPGVARIGESIEATVENAKVLEREHRHEALTAVASGKSPDHDAGAMRALREAFGGAMRLRLECLGAYDASGAAALLRQVDDLDLEYVADPVAERADLERVRRGARTPLATGRLALEDLAPIVRADAAEVIIGNSVEWGGIAAFRKSAAVCRAFSMDIAIAAWDGHGLALATSLHLVPTLAASKGLHALAFDAAQSLLAGGPFVRNGHIIAPDGPGFGASIDRERLRQRKRDEAVVSSPGAR
jgi:L-alanine-DL-glutamate epimerase-like enolase superfamily enzyme